MCMSAAHTREVIPGAVLGLIVVIASQVGEKGFHFLVTSEMTTQTIGRGCSFTASDHKRAVQNLGGGSHAAN